MNVPQLCMELGVPLQKGDVVRVEYRTKVGREWRYIVRTGVLQKSRGVHLKVQHLISGRKFRIPAAEVVSIRREE